jgi:hypothetical protein
MTVEIDLDRVAEVTDRLRRHRGTLDAIGRHLGRLGNRMDLVDMVAPAVTTAERIADGLGYANTSLTRRAEQAVQADTAAAADAATTSAAAGEWRSFAGGTALCSGIQLVSPIPARPSTSGVTGVIDAGGIAHDAVSLADTAATGASLGGRSVPFAAVTAAVVDTVLCRLRVGSGAPISTRTIVDDDGNEIYEGSRSHHKYMVGNGEPLASDPERRDQQMWRLEHSNENGFLMEPYPGFPAYEINDPNR